MFGKNFKIKAADILFDTILSDTDHLKTKIVENNLLNKRLFLRNNFPYLSYIYHLHIYEDLLRSKYNQKSVSDVIMYCIDKMANQPTSNQVLERKKILLEAYNMVLEDKREAVSFDAFIFSMVFALFEGQIEVVLATDGESVKSLIDCFLNHFKQIRTSSKIMQMDLGL